MGSTDNYTYGVPTIYEPREPSGAGGSPTDPDAPGNIRQSSDATTSGTLKMRLDAPASDDAIASYEVQYRPKPTP